MHGSGQGRAFGVCLANKVSKPAWIASEGAEKVVMLDGLFCQLEVCTRAV